MKISFINPPFLSKYGKYSREQRSPAITKSGTFYYPMWLSYAAGYTEKMGHEIQLWDAPADGWDSEEILRKLTVFDPGLVIVATSTPSIYSDVEFAAKVKEKFKDSFITLVGVHVSALHEETLALNHSLDAVAVGEYEHTILELAEQLENKDSLSQIKGLVYRDSLDPKKIIANPKRPHITYLDEIPWVSRTYKKYLNYKNYFYSGNLYPLIVFNTSRGCPHRCSFCVYPQIFTGHLFRCRSIGDAVDEVEYVVKEFSQLGEIMFEDDTLTIDEKRTMKFCEEILRRNITVRWSCNARVQLGLETMKLMKRSGCRSLLVGFESGAQEVLDGMRKGNNLPIYEQFMNDTRKAGLLVNGTFLVGCPGENKKTMRATLDMAKKLKPDVAQFFPVMVYPGTVMYDEYQKQGYIVSDNFRGWINEEGLHNCVIDLPEVSAKEMVIFCDACRKEFYLRPGYMFYKGIQSLLSPSEGVRTFKAARKFFKPLFLGTKLD
jgi:anaerobic magnesium-protoporphyrin IX monomethyl ester cyclase